MITEVMVCERNNALSCHETKTGEGMKVLLRERVWNCARAGMGNLLKNCPGIGIGLGAVVVIALFFVIQVVAVFKFLQKI